MSHTIPVAQYLFGRLRQLGCYSVHGVPGDFCLRTLDHLPASRVKWIGNANELCSGYAADGYARAAAMARRSHSSIPKVGALLTTFGVGELSVINAIAGAYAESVPLVHMVGTPVRQAWRGSAILHHTMADGRLHVYADMARQVTCAQADLSCDDIEEALDRYDRALVHCVRKSKPVYVNIPGDIVGKQIPSQLLDIPLQTEAKTNWEDAAKEDELVKYIFNRMNASQRPLIIADGLAYSWDMASEANDITQLTGIPATCFNAGKGVIDEHHPSWLGALTAPTEYSQSTDLAILFGPLLSNTNTAAWTAVPDPSVSVSFNLDNVIVDGNVIPVRGKTVLKKLVGRLIKEKSMARNGLSSSLRTPGQGATPLLSAHISQDAFWHRMASWLRPHDTILLANGTPLIGGRSISLPTPTQVIASGIWCSMGSMLPCAQGVALAKHDHGIDGRTVLFEGDGSFQVTCQSISDIIRYKLDVTIFICNNDGYTYERLLHGLKEEYNDVPSWNYVNAPAFFGARADADYETASRRVENWGQLEEVLQDEVFSNGKGLKIVEMKMDPEDVPESARAGLQKASEVLRSV